jgi:hypothetical protein
VSSPGITLSLLMKLVALIALDLFFLRVHPFLPQSPLQLFALVMLDLVIIQYFILGRRLGAFYYTFVIVGLVASMALHTLSLNSLHVLETLIGLCQQITGTPTWRPVCGSRAKRHAGCRHQAGHADLSRLTSRVH